jgi:prophage regulatory protein
MGVDDAMQIPVEQEVLYRLPAVIAITGRKRSALYKDIAAQKFPRPVRLGAQSVAWRKSDLDRWIASLPVAE